MKFARRVAFECARWIALRNPDCSESCAKKMALDLQRVQIYAGGQLSLVAVWVSTECQQSMHSLSEACSAVPYFGACCKAL